MNAIPRLRAVRGATTVDANTSAEIRGRTGELLAAILERNDLRQAEIVSVLVTATPDLSADFPAVAAREMGLSATPLLCCQEIPVRDAIARCIRVLMHCYVPEGMQVRHVYLRDARQLRLDLPE